MRWRPYDGERDAEAVVRIWREVNWIEDSDTQKEGVKTFFRGGRSWVAPAEGDAECAVHTTPGSYRWLDEELPLWAVTAVTTSRIARRQNLATELMTEALATGVDEGAAVAMLGAFEQGYYDRFGFGTGPYEHELQCDPSTLDVPVPDRAPVRLTPDDHAEITELMHRRHRAHGGVRLDSVHHMEAELAWHENWWGLGFRATDGRLTHFVFGEVKGHRGPYLVNWIAYEEPAQLIELLGAIKTLSDQVQVVAFKVEPPELQLQDLISHPNRQAVGHMLGGKQFSFNSAHAVHQTRILDLERCLSRVSWPGRPVSFDLHLTDPLAKHNGRWAGIGGEYSVTLSDESTVGERPAADGRPVLEATVNALSRMWVGARPATGLALLGGLRGPDELLGALDRVFRLPTPHPGMDF